MSWISCIHQIDDRLIRIFHNTEPVFEIKTGKRRNISTWEKVDEMGVS